MKPKVTNRVVKSYRLSRLDGVKDVEFGSASIESRAQRDFSKDGRASGDTTSKGFDDAKAREKRFGFYF